MNSPPFFRLQQELLSSAQDSSIQYKEISTFSADIELSQKSANRNHDQKIEVSSKENNEESPERRQDNHETQTEINNQGASDQIPLVSQQESQEAVFDNRNGNLFGNNEEFLPRIEAKLYLQRNIAFFIGIGLTSLATILMINKHTTSQSIFVALYSYLVYCLIDNYKRTQITRREHWRIREDSISMIDNVVNLLFLALLNLSIIGAIPFRVGFALPYFFTTILYPFLSKGTRNTKIVRMALRIIFTIQVFMISLKLSKIIAWNWFFVLLTSGVYLVVVFGFMFSICLAFGYTLKGDDEFFCPSLKGLGWHFFYYALGVVALLTILGVTFAFSSKRGFGVLEVTAYIGLGISSLLIVYTIAIFKELIVHIQDFWLSDHYLLEPLPQWTTEKKQEIGFKTEKSLNYFLTVSTTYFRKLENKSEFMKNSNETNGRQDEYEQTEIKNNEDENLCYLCYEKSCNAILGDCGHGGVCYDCVIPLIKKKNKCMECRCEVHEIYKVEQDLENPSIVKSVELSKVVLR